MSQYYIELTSTHTHRNLPSFRSIAPSPSKEEQEEHWFGKSVLCVGEFFGLDKAVGHFDGSVSRRTTVIAVSVVMVILMGNVSISWHGNLLLIRV